MKIIPFALVLCSLAFAGCTSASRNQKQDNPGYTTAAADKYGSDASFHFNEDSSYVLIKKQPKSSADNPYPLLQFFVFDIRQNRTIFEDSLPMATVLWENNENIRVNITQGQVEEGSSGSGGYIFNVRTIKKIPL
ncbi:MAG: hypothetical protein ACM3Q2_19395 [Syntrophothermus sp.]